MIQFLRKIRGLSYVVRWNFHPHVRDESVAEHSFYVAIYAIALAQVMGRGETYLHEITLAALLHDAEESITGDLPALVKRHTANWHAVVERAQVELFGNGEKAAPLLAANGAAEHFEIVKAADLFAALVYADEECKIGNSTFERIRRELIGSLGKIVSGSDTELGVAVLSILKGLGFDPRDGVGRPDEMSHL